MSQDERDGEAALAKQHDEMRSQGLSLGELGAKRAKGLEPGDMNELAEEKVANASRHVGRVRTTLLVFEMPRRDCNAILWLANMTRASIDRKVVLRRK